MVKKETTIIIKHKYTGNIPATKIFQEVFEDQIKKEYIKYKNRIDADKKD